MLLSRPVTVGKGLTMSSLLYYEQYQEYCQARGWKQVGLNADWCIEAYQIDGTDNRNGSLVFDNEDGTFSVTKVSEPDLDAEELASGSWPYIQCYLERTIPR